MPEASKAALLRQDLRNHKREGDALSKRLLAFSSDTSEPLDERWNVFIKSGMGRIDSSFVEFASLGHVGDLCRYHHCERYRTVDADDILGWLEDHKFPSMHERLHTIEAFKEEVLKLGISGFIYDW